MVAEVLFCGQLIEPVKWRNGVMAGFIVFPHSDEQPAGWGEPYYATDGSPIWPGTPDGENPNRAIGYTADGWRMKRSSMWQVAGAIDWWGPWKSDKQEKRFVVSVNGPNARHFNPGGVFQYDGDDKHHEIYMDGKLLSIAPLPVLGAALCQWEKLNPDGNYVTTYTLVCVCKDGTSEVALARPGSLSGTAYDSVTDDMRTGLKKYRSDTNPNGWVVVCNASMPSGAAPPETPYFFGADAQQARAMRRVVKEFTNEEGETKTQNAYAEAIFTFNPATNTGNIGYIEPAEDEMVRYHEDIVKTHPTWTDPIEGDNWQEDIVIANTEQRGTVKIAVEWNYDVNDWVYGWLEIFDRRRIEQYWTEGTSGTNIGNYTGRRYPPGDVPFPGDHTAAPWLGVSERRTLKIGKLISAPIVSVTIGYGQSGSKQLAETGVEDNSEDPYFYFWDSLDMFIHHLDMRSMLIAGRIRYDTMLLPQSGPNYGMLEWYYEIMETASPSMSDVPWDEDSFFYRHTSETSLPYNALFFEWYRSTMNTWPDAYDFSWDTTDYQGAVSTANSGGSKYDPELDTYYLPGFFDTVENPNFHRFDVDDYFMLVQHCHREGQFSSDEKDNMLVTYEYIHEGKNEPEQGQRLYPVDGVLADICKGGEKFHGGGVM
jgi:hypothetical protein